MPRSRGCLAVEGMPRVSRGCLAVEGMPRVSPGCLAVGILGVPGCGGHAKGIPGVPGCGGLAAMIWDAIQRAKAEKGNLDVVWLDLVNAYGSVPHKMIHQLALEI
ncbi:hypothetical protein ACOMHN_017421 [Nucella lapillus]